MAIVNPYIKKQENIEWLEKNEESFLRFMASHHSLIDIVHTYLHMDTFNDSYVEKMIIEVEKTEKKAEKEAAARKRKRAGKKVSEDKKSTVIEKKIAKMEEAAEEIERDEDPLLD